MLHFTCPYLLFWSFKLIQKSNMTMTCFNERWTNDISPFLWYAKFSQREKFSRFLKKIGNFIRDFRWQRHISQRGTPYNMLKPCLFMLCMDLFIFSAIVIQCMTSKILTVQQSEINRITFEMASIWTWNGAIWNFVSNPMITSHL